MQQIEDDMKYISTFRSYCYGAWFSYPVCMCWLLEKGGGGRRIYVVSVSCTRRQRTPKHAVKVIDLLVSNDQYVTSLCCSKSYFGQAPVVACQHS